MVQRKLRLKILPTAISDLKEIASYIALNSPKYAKIEVDRIIAFLRKIPTHPLKGKSFFYKNIEAHQLIFKHYLIIYKIDDSFIVILTIHHSARLISNHPNLDDNA